MTKAEYAQRLTRDIGRPSADQIECPDCDGSGFTMLTRCCGYHLPHGECCGKGTDEKESCEFCQGQGWREMTADEESDAAERQAEDRASGEPPMSVQEMYEAAYRLKQELRR